MLRSGASKRPPSTSPIRTWLDVDDATEFFRPVGKRRPTRKRAISPKKKPRAPGSSDLSDRGSSGYQFTPTSNCNVQSASLTELSGLMLNWLCDINHLRVKSSHMQRAFSGAMRRRVAVFKEAVSAIVDRAERQTCSRELGPKIFFAGGSVPCQGEEDCQASIQF